MDLRDRNELGRYVPKSSEERQVRSLRATDSTWNKFGEMADSQGITRADLLEVMVDKDTEQPCNTWNAREEIEQILNDALSLKANSGGAIKAKIREALKLIQDS